MAFDFLDKRVVVTGGSRGIGRAIALGFAAAGAGVSICARKPDVLERTRTEIAGKGHGRTPRSATWPTVQRCSVT